MSMTVIAQMTVDQAKAVLAFLETDDAPNDDVRQVIEMLRTLLSV